MKSTEDENLLEKLKEAFESIPPFGSDSVPKESLPLGTVVRAKRHNKLAVITDSFYGDTDKDGQKIIIYTILLLPNKNSFSQSTQRSEQLYVSNEYEYDVIAYLMIPPINLSKFTMNLEGNHFL